MLDASIPKAMDSIESSLVKHKLFVCSFAGFMGFILLSYGLFKEQSEDFYSSLSPPLLSEESIALPPQSNALMLPSSDLNTGKLKEEECDVFDGRWVSDRRGYPVYEARQCPFFSDQVNCQKNGRPDSGYEHWRWEPKGCKLPRHTGRDILERWRGKRVVIVGDSLNRNMWESLACMLYSSMHNKSHAYVKVHGSEYKIFRAMEYDCTVEFYWSPFLVKLEEREGHSKVLKLDELPEAARRWRRADVMVFNTGHWWTHQGKLRAWEYFERRGEVVEMEVHEAFNRALRTWAHWVDRSVDLNKTRVFFRSISPEHKRENWCYNQTHPLTNETYVQWFPRTMISIVKRRIRKMRTPVKYLDITRLSEYRIDGHTSVYTTRQGKLLSAEQRKQPHMFADCSHWCLPGVPDTWNLLLFASLMEIPSNVP